MHFLEQELVSQPRTLLQTLDYLETNRAALTAAVRNRESVILFACGSHYYISLTAKSVHDALCDSVCYCYPASELVIYRERLIKKSVHNGLAIGLSRSGQTTEMLLAQRVLKENPSLEIVGISAADGNEFLGGSDFPIALGHVDEKSVPSTRSTSSFLLTLLYLSLLEADATEEIERLRGSVNSTARVFEDRDFFKDVVGTGDIARFIFLGVGSLYGIARESSLKALEMTQNDSYAFQTLEFRHGPMSLITEDSLVVLFSSSEAVEFEKKLVSELAEYGASVVVVCGQGDAAHFGNARWVYTVAPNNGDISRCVPYLTCGQSLAFARSCHLGLDAGQPKIISKYVQL